jgi:hypothetical protein
MRRDVVCDAAQPRTHQVRCSARRPVVSMYQWSIRVALPLIHGIRLQRDDRGSAEDHGTFTARTANSRPEPGTAWRWNAPVACSKTGHGPALLPGTTTQALEASGLVWQPHRLMRHTTRTDPYRCYQSHVAS